MIGVPTRRQKLTKRFSSLAPPRETKLQPLASRLRNTSAFERHESSASAARASQAGLCYNGTNAARRISSAVEQRFCKPKVGGSIPSSGTDFIRVSENTSFNFDAG